MPWRAELSRLQGIVCALQAQVYTLSPGTTKPGDAIAGLFACVPNSIAVGDVVCELVAGTLCDRASAASADTAAVGVCLQVVNPALALIVYNGELLIFSGLIPDAIYYLDVAPGGLTAVAPSAVGQIVQKIGRAKNSTTLVVEVTPQFIQL
jgi:hypothetical protein